MFKQDSDKQQVNDNLTLYLYKKVSDVRLTVESYKAAMKIVKAQKIKRVKVAEVVFKLHAQLQELDAISHCPDFEKRQFSTDLCQQRLQTSIELLLEDYHTNKRMIDFTPTQKRLKVINDPHFH